MQHAGDLVDAVHVDRGNHRFDLNVGKERDFAPLVRGQRPIRTAQQDIGLDTDLAKLLDRMLRRLGLDFACQRYAPGS